MAHRKGIPISVLDKEYFSPPTIPGSSRADRSEIDAFVLETTDDLGVDIGFEMFKLIRDGIYASYMMVYLEKQMEDRKQENKATVDL